MQLHGALNLDQIAKNGLSFESCWLGWTELRWAGLGCSGLGWAELGAPPANFLKIAWAGAELGLGWTGAGRAAGENFENCLGWGWAGLCCRSTVEGEPLIAIKWLSNKSKMFITYSATT